MALVKSRQPLQKPSIVGPTALLENALRSFENTLSNEQRLGFRLSLAQPGSSSAMLLIAEIDAVNQNSRKGVAVRLWSFLNAIQQFATVVDYFGAPNSNIAALMWGSVKATLLSAHQAASSFEEVTTMMMEIGRTCPTYDGFGCLYEDQHDVQAALCAYYAIIIRICAKLMQINNQSLSVQIWSVVTTSFDSEFKYLREELNQSERVIQQKLLMASQRLAYQSFKLTELETKASKSQHKFVAPFHAKTKKEQDQAQRWRLTQEKYDSLTTRQRILSKLSCVNVQKIWSRIQSQRMLGTAEWFKQNSSFNSWVDAQSTSILWCSGYFGVGKSVLVSSIIQHLKSLDVNGTSTAFHFCVSEVEETLSARNIVGTIARQLLTHDIDSILKEITPEQSEDLSTTDVIDLVINYLGDTRKHFVIVDGLDDCSEHEITELTTALRRLCNKSKGSYRILLSSRPDLRNLLFKQVKYDLVLALSEDLVVCDNKLFIDEQIRLCCESGRLSVREPRLISEIADTLESNCNGMFLWLSLFIDELCAKNSDASIRKALKHPPKKIYDLYERKLARTRAHCLAEQALEALRYSGIAKRSLTLEELREVLSIRVGQKELGHSLLPNDMNLVISACCGLLRMDEEDWTVHYVHHSLKSYLLMDPETRKDDTFDSLKLDLHFGHLCVTYLQYKNFTQQKQVARSSSMSKVKLSPANFGIVPILSPYLVSSVLAEKILKLRRRRAQMSIGEFERKLRESIDPEDFVRKQHDNQSLRFAFLAYATEFWLCHVKDIKPSLHSDCWELFHTCVTTKQSHIIRPWDLNVNNKQFPTQSDNTALDAGLEKDLDDPDKVLLWAITDRHKALFLHQLLYPTAVSCYTQEQLMGIAVERSLCSFDNLVECLVFDEWAVHELIYCIASFGDEMMWKQLLSFLDTPKVPFVHAIDCLDPQGLTALLRTVSSDNLEGAEQLLLAGADVNALDKEGRSSLMIAVCLESKKMTTLLITRGADVTAVRRGSLDTALHQAVTYSGSEMVAYLVEAGSNIEARDSEGRTPLLYAISYEKLASANILIAAGADVLAHDNKGSSMIHLAILHRGDSVRCLDYAIAAGADINATNHNGETPLDLARRYERHDIVAFLLGRDAILTPSSAQLPGRANSPDPVLLSIMPLSS